MWSGYIPTRFAEECARDHEHRSATPTVATRHCLLSHTDEVMILVPDCFGGSYSLGSLHYFTVAVNFCSGHATDDHVRPPAEAIEAGRSNRTGELCRI